MYEMWLNLVEKHLTINNIVITQEEIQNHYLLVVSITAYSYSKYH